MQNQIEQLYQLFHQSTGVTIDNRKISGGEMFFGLQGDKVNGSIYAKAALDNGALCCVINDDQYKINEKCIVVEDVLIALQLLAAKYRSTFNFPVLALTGSNGKTTTKELIAAVLSKKYRVSATKGNLNNHIGVPLTILSVPKDCNFAVIEMGANHQKEIGGYCKYANPDFALITNIGKAHLEGFGGIEGVLKGKSELFEFVQQKNGMLFINSSEKKLKALFSDYPKMITYGFEANDYASGKMIIGDEFAQLILDDNITIQSHLVGDYNNNNIMAAACIGKYFGVEVEDIKAAIEAYQPDNNRSELKEVGGNYFIMDAYNANPSSMQAAIENFSKLNATHKIAILGDMLELGDYAVAEHQAIMDLVLKSNVTKVVTVGPVFAALSNKNVLAFPDAAAAKKWYAAQAFKGATILLKGSRGMHLEEIIS